MHSIPMPNIIGLILPQETYPQSAPIWFSDSEDSSVVDVVGELGDTKEEQYNVSMRSLCITSAGL